MITLEQTNKAALSVQKELYNVGLWYEHTRLFQTNIYFTKIPMFTMPWAGGIFTHGLSLIHKIQGYEEGHIYIPRWILAHLFWQHRGSLKDIIRHEYGHALAHYYPELIVESTSFEKVFGGNYYDYKPIEMNASSFVSQYAKTMPMEDFAETFMVYVRRKGILPTKVIDDRLIQKWMFVASICAKIY